MSSTGATLSGSFSGATTVPSAAGFKYGTTSDLLNQTALVSVSNTSGDLEATLSSLQPGTTYFYKAFATVSGTGDYASQSLTFSGTEYSFTTKKIATATVSTNAATSVTSSSAQLNGSFNGASGQIYETGFYWGTSENSLTNQVTTDGSNASSGIFNCTIGGSSPLNASTTYYFKAYIREWNENTNDWEYRYGSVKSFTTTATQPAGYAYLTDYGMPDVSGIVTGLRQSGTNSARDDKWYSFNTSTSTRQIAVHTYTHPTSNVETASYVVLYDGSKYAPLWTAHTMNTTQWPDNNVGRNEDWGNDPAINLTQQSGLDDANTVGYSRGHLVASEYRQSSVKQNMQTFYRSNQAPQWQVGFNGSSSSGDGVWQTLENKVRSLAPSGTTMLYVVTGVLYEGTVENGEIVSSTIPTKKSGSLNVPIPSHFYKCIMKCTFSGSTVTGAQGIAFVYTNESHTGESYDKASFVTSIDSIEQRAGFDFFANVPSDLQATAEANTTPNWFTKATNLSSVGTNNWGGF